ncbi:BMC domain-containing protein [Lachnotalea sp. AF33-28]|jgi:ethanolamine utilization protein EutM|uniref:BMC domain-containing protein n=1 Tax=Lachnotalea sp. AF33-28 TaxID=2292046 RepID=UPI000E52D849|nr:BMC domain-containing protein [Lachnotalea sp. AF33-28]RHP34528.1 BMC domain-containing protein [Lachnotalea sp. AF33-28]
MAQAVGFLEVYGLVAAFAAADAGCKAANVTLETFDRNKPANADSLPVPLLITVKYRGSVEDVKAALEAGKAAAEKISGVVAVHEIAAPTSDTEKMLKLSGFDKD